MESVEDGETKLMTVFAIKKYGIMQLELCMEKLPRPDVRL